MKAKNEFEKSFFKLMINSVFGKTMENLRKHRGIKLVTTDGKRSKLVSESNYYTTKQFSENLLAIEMKKTKAKINKPVYLGMSILDISKTLMYKVWYDYIKAKLCYTDTDSIIIHIIHIIKIILKTLLVILKYGLILLTMKRTIKDLFQ